MLVSIIINNYNYARYLATAIDSALAQTWHPLEVIVVDDGSTDDSWAVIERYGERVHAIRQANGGQGAAYNAGFAASRGEWVIFLDSDDVLDVGARGAYACERLGRGGQGARAIYAASTPMASRSAGQCPTSRTTATCGRSPNAFSQYGAPPSSGNLYRRRTIAPYFPMRRAGVASQCRHRAEPVVRIPWPGGDGARHHRLLPACTRAWYGASACSETWMLHLAAH